MYKPIIPALAVLGKKASGKTTAVEIIVKALTGRQLNVMTIKHVSQEGFTLDKGGTDTWRHWKAGARIVSAISDSEKAIMIKDGEHIELSMLDCWAGKVDAIVFEGFSSLLLGEENVGKVICLKEWSEKETYLSSIRGTLVALCSLNLEGHGILKLGLDDGILAERATQFLSATSAE